jgi:thymidylate synthase (FAD)
VKVEYVEHMGSDLSVVNAARVSFDKVSEYKYDEQGQQYLTEADSKLIKYLAKHQHWTPFAHTAVKFRIKAPIFVARQLVKHQIGLVWNEKSRRYVTDTPEFFMPPQWRKSAENVKQGSSDERISTLKETVNFREDGFPDYEKPIYIHRVDPVEIYNCGETHSVYEYSFTDIAEQIYQLTEKAYTRMIAEGVCAEQARMILPQALYTEWVWTGNVQSFARVCNLRLDPHTQLETRLIAKKISDIMEVLYPVSWEALRKN